MAIIQTYKCDNPECGQVGEPEARDARGKPTQIPYGWYYLKGYCQGQENLEIVTCSTSCIGPAIDYLTSDN